MNTVVWIVRIRLNYCAALKALMNPYSVKNAPVIAPKGRCRYSQRGALQRLKAVIPEDAGTAAAAPVVPAAISS